MIISAFYAFLYLPEVIEHPLNFNSVNLFVSYNLA